jgi:hypothetical protein
MGIICKNIYFPSTSDTYELRNLAKFMFLNKGEKPLEIIYIYLSKYFGRSIKGSEIVILLSLSIGLFKSRKEAISEILKLEKKIFEASKLEISQLLNDKSSLLKWSEVFSQTIYPDEVKLFDEKHSILNNRLREPSKGSLGQIGSFFSKKCGRNILYESGEEYRLYQIMENASKVVYYQEQPLAIPYKSYFKNKEYLYYPDIAVLTNDGRLVVIEVKPIISMVEQFTLEKSIAAISYLHDRGIGFNLVDASGNSIRKMRLFGENRLIEQKMLKIIDEKGILDYQTYKILIENTRLTGKQFAGFVVRNDLSLLRFPFRISRLPRELTFKIFG